MMRLRHPLCLLPLAAALASPAARGAPASDAIERVRDQTLLWGADGAAVFVGSDRAQTLDVKRWAERIMARVERVLGLALPRDGVRLRIVVRERRAVSESAVHTYRTLRRGRLDLSLLIPDYQDADLAAAEHALCKLLLEAHVAARGEAGNRPAPPPYWLARGLQLNLAAERLAELRPGLARLAGEGRIGSLASAMAAEAPVGPEALARADLLGGFLVRWLSERPSHPEPFASLLRRLGRGNPVDLPWLAGAMPDKPAIAELDADWEQWLLKQTRTAHLPGRATSAGIAQLKAELLLYPGGSGIAVEDSGSRPLRPADLVARREGAWIPAACRRVQGSLRVLASGRGREFQAVVEAYCRFFEALGRRDSAPALRDLLDRADTALDALETLARAGETE